MLKNNNIDSNNNADPLYTYYTLREHTTVNETRFGISKLYTTLSIMFSRNLNYWDEIIPGLLYLGIIPSKADAELIHSQIANLGMVCSTVEPFELNGSAITKISIQSPADWKKMNVKHHLLIIPDFTANVDVSLLYRTLLAIDDEIKQGRAVYVHCKAGRGRSATVIACYLALFKPELLGLNPESSIKEVIEFLKSKRSQVRLGKEQIEKMEELLEHHKKEAAKDAKPIPAYQSMHDYLTSYETKEKIAQLAYFKELMLYASEKQHKKPSSQRGKQIQDFLNQIYFAKDKADWYLKLVCNKGPLQNLLDARPYNGMFNTGAPKIRQTLVDGLKEELKDMLINQFSYTEPQYNSMIKMESEAMDKPILARFIYG